MRRRRTPLLVLALSTLAPLGAAVAQTAESVAFGDLTALDVATQRAVAREALEQNARLAYDPTSVLVRFHPETSEARRAELRALVGLGTLVRYRTVDDLELIDVQLAVPLALDTLEPFVAYAEPNWVQRKTATPNDTYFSLQWGCHNTGQTIQGQAGIADADIDATEAWNLTTGSANFVVADIDTGCDWSHPDLAANIWSNPGEIAGNGLDDDGNGYVDDVRGWDFYSSDNNPQDSDGHGSHTAGTLGAVGNNGTGVCGVAWACKIVPLRFLGPQGGYTSDAVLAVEYCTQKAIKVSNNSWGGGGFSQALFDAINASKAVGHVFVAAAGNDGTNNDSLPHYPSNYSLDNVISVAATDNRDALANEGTWGSNYGATSVDLGAPGVDIASTYMSGGYVWMSGTSMATPHVTGVVTLLYAQNPGWTYSQIVDRILSTTRPLASLAGKCTTGGMLNAYDALNTGGGGGGDVTPPAAPTGLAATAGDGSVSLDWNDNGEADLAGYRVWRSTTSGGGYTAVSGLLAASAYVDPTVTNGVTYFYVVTAEDASTNVSGNSQQVSATPQAAGGSGGQVQTLFFGGFESGTFTGWATSGNVAVSTQADQGGTYGARISRTSWIEASISTAGYDTIELSYARRTSGLDNGENLYVEYWNGSSWVNVETTRSTSWAFPTWSLGGDADDNAAFKIRFRTNANRNNERADVDDVEVVGTTL
ncbi:MAG: S8 family serine peptidase [Planctomycetes bacterium]|nr:S8 family serine peptidase [Planctomycetota bacterium]